MTIKNIILFLTLLLFFSIMFSIWKNPFEIDKYVNLLATYIQNDSWKYFFDIIAWLWDVYWVIIISLWFIYYFYKNKMFLEIKILFFTMIATVSTSTIIKFIIARVRPENMIVQYWWFSFPSWHSTMAVLFYWLLYLFLEKNIKSKNKKNLLLFSFIVFWFLIIFSRIYLAVHWFSDVIWWLLLWTFFLILGSSYYKKVKNT